MKNNEVIEWLEYLKEEMEEWDQEEYSKEIEKCEEAINIAEKIISSNKVVGTLTIGDDTYTINK